MNIAFWSNVRHQSGVTSCVALISVLWVELFVEEIAVTSNHVCSFGVAKRLYGGIEFEERTAKKAYNYVLGEPEYFRMLYSGKIRSSLWLGDNLRFIPMEGDTADLFGNEGLRGINDKKTEKEYLFIDTACGYSLGSQRILEEAEIKVIVFPPNRECIDTFFQSENGLWKESFFILGNYQTVPSCRPSYLTKRYGISKERIGVIPYDVGFEQAMREGNTISYVTRHMNCSRRSSAYRFIQCAGETVENLRNYVISRRERECGEYGEV